MPKNMEFDNVIASSLKKALLGLKDGRLFSASRGMVSVTIPKMDRCVTINPCAEIPLGIPQMCNLPVPEPEPEIQPKKRKQLRSIDDDWES